MREDSERLSPALYCCPLVLPSLDHRVALSLWFDNDAVTAYGPTSAGHPRVPRKSQARVLNLKQVTIK